MKNRFKLKFFLFSLILIFLSACSLNPVTGKKNFSLISEQQEIQMGAQAHRSVLKQMKKYNNAKLQSYVNSIGQTLASHSHRKNIRFTFTIIEDPSVNAFALPGGYVYITTGLMAYLNSEAELAGVLGHEIGHVTARHGVQQQSAGIASAILVDLISKRTESTNAKSLQQLSSALLSGYGREHELQADQLGAEYLARLGYPPETMIKVISVLKAQEDFARAQARSEGRQPSSYHGVFSSHPTNDRRLHEVINAAQKYQSSRSRAINHDVYLRKIDGLKYRIDKRRTGKIVVGRATSRGLTYAKLARQSIVGEQRLRLLNGMYPKGQPVHGKLVKVIQ